MAKFAEVPYYLLDAYFEEAHTGVAPEGYSIDTETGYQDVKFEDTDSTSTNWEWIDLNDWSWGRTYILFPPAWSDGSSLIGDRHGLVGRGGYWTELFVDIDGDLTAVNFRSDSTEWVNSDGYFIFTKDPSGADFDNGSDVYFRKDSFIHEYVARLATSSGDDIYNWYFNPEKKFIYFGKVFLTDSDTREHRIQWYGYPDYALQALPPNNRTAKIETFFDLYFDRIYSALYGMLKNLVTLLDPEEVDIDYLTYIAEMYGVTISEEISGAEWSLDEREERDFVQGIIHWLKRKGTYTALYVLWKLLVDKNDNLLNIYERWDSSATPSVPSLPNFTDYVYPAYYNVDAGSNLVNNGNMEIDAYWDDYGTPTANVRSSDQSFDGSSSRLFRSATGSDGIKSDGFSTTIGESYKCSAYVWPVDNTNVKIHLTRGSGTGEAFSTSYSSLSLNQWNYISTTGEQAFTGENTSVVISSPSGGRYYVDNVRVHNWTGAGQYYYESQGTSAYPASHGSGSGMYLSPHYKVELDLSNAPLGDDYIMNESTLYNLIKYWEMIRPVSRVSHYRLLISPTADFTGVWNALYGGAYIAELNTVCIPTIAEAAAGSSFFTQVTSSDEWLVTHTLSSQQLIIQCFDHNDERLLPENIQITGGNSATVELYAPDSGLVLMCQGDYAHDESSAASTWNFTCAGATKEKLIQVYDRNRNRIEPLSINDDGSTAVTITFSSATSGYAYAKEYQYKHDQNTAAITWNIYHNLDVLACIVHCFDSSGNRIYPSTLKLQSSNLAMATFDSAQAGYALVLGVGAPNTQGSVWLPCTSGYIKLGDADETEAWNPWLHNDIKNTVWTIPNEKITYKETDNYYYITTENPLSTLETSFTEIGVFNVDDELVWYTYCDPLYKSEDVGLTLHYRIER
jgi:hypothetical protein